MTSCRCLRVLWAVFMAVMGTVCVPGGASAASAARAAETAREGCCPGRSAGNCCCCEARTPVGLAALVTPKANATLAVSSVAPRVEPSRAGHCECSVGQPASPGSKPQSNLGEREKDTRATLPLKVFTASTRPATAFRRNLASRGSPPDSPLYLRNSRLLI
jgi:hypothetical protein